MTRPIDQSPPAAPIAFRVGVVGHRLNRLPADPHLLDALKARLGEALAAVKAAVDEFGTGNPHLYAAGDPNLLAVSSLAEGSDRLFATAALDHGFGLCVPMPFFQAEFEKDFETSVSEFRDLLARAETGCALTRFELDGHRDTASAAYSAAAGIVLNQSDLLVAVWDGAPPHGQGGTGETVRLALEHQVPVLWVRPQPPFDWQILHHPTDLDTALSGGDMQKQIAGLVKRELDLPDDRAAGPEGEAITDPNVLANAYFREKAPSPYRHLFWKSMRNAFGGGGPILPRPRPRDFLAQAEQEEHCCGDPTLIPDFAWADRLADYYADAHRSNVVVSSFLSAAAVLLGIAPYVLGLNVHDDLGWLVAFTAIELVVIVSLANSLRRAQRKRWHEKWLEYRILAEWLRQLRFMTPLGGGRPLLRARPHLAVYGDPLRSWMYWHVRAIARARALPTAVADTEHLTHCLNGIIATIGDTDHGQIGFHGSTMARNERIHERLHRTTVILVRIVIVAIAAHLVVLVAHVDLPEMLERVFDGFVLLCATFVPALGAALANINNQGEFARLTKRARAMRDALIRIGAEAAVLRKDLDRPEQTVALSQVSKLAGQMAATMLEEVIDWRVVVFDLPQGLE